MPDANVYKFPDAAAWPNKPAAEPRPAGVPVYSMLVRNPVPVAKLEFVPGPPAKKVNTMLLKLEPAGVINDSPQKSTPLPADGPVVFSSIVTARAAGNVHKQRAQKRSMMGRFISSSAARLCDDALIGQALSRS